MVVGRILQPGAIVRVHTSPPGSTGAGEIGRSDPVSLGQWSSGGEFVTNLVPVEVLASASGTPRYISIWMGGKIRGHGPLTKTDDLMPGDTAVFPRGELTVRWP